MPKENTAIRSRFDQRDLIIDPKADFAVELKGPIAEADVSLVIDIYSLDSPMHPDGHVGWWKFPILADTPALLGELVAGPEGIVLNLGGLAPSESWRNPEIGPESAYLVLAVLRSNVTNAVVHIDRIPMMTSAAQLAEFRGRVSHDWLSPRYRPAGFLLGRGETVHLVAPEIRPRDAVGNLCLALYRLLKQNGIPARLHADIVDLSLNDVVEPKSHLADAVGPHDQILYFYSIDDPSLATVMDLVCARKTAYFHGITNPKLLRVFDPEASMACERALASMPTLRSFDRLAANSATSADFLSRTLGEDLHPRIVVIPPQIVAPEQLPLNEAPRDNALLFVGQIRPHKKVEDLLRLHAAYLESFPEAQCWIVGANENKAYRDYLDWVQREELQLPPDSVRWLGTIPKAELDACYERASAYVSMSEDEGFCLPLIEAMRHGLPVFAYDIPAVRETRGTASIGFSRKEPGHLAGQIAQLLGDPVRRAQIVAGQYERAASLAETMRGAGFLSLLAP